MLNCQTVRETQSRPISRVDGAAAHVPARSPKFAELSDLRSCVRIGPGLFAQIRLVKPFQASRGSGRSSPGRSLIPSSIVAASGLIRVDRAATGWRDRGRAYKVLVDGQQDGRVKNGGSFEWPVEAGEHRVQLKLDWASSPEVPVTVAADETSVLGGSAKPMENALVMLIEATFRSKEYISLQAASSSSAREGARQAAHRHGSATGQEAQRDLRAWPKNAPGPRSWQAAHGRQVASGRVSRVSRGIGEPPLRRVEESPTASRLPLTCARGYDDPSYFATHNLARVCAGARC